MKLEGVRTRFAPSPTGYMHVGNLRTALYAYLMAKSQGGTFILRIEDTDQERYVEGAVDIIYNTLKEAGLYWDEGPDIGGPVGPYVQSERMPMFKKYAEQLVESGALESCPILKAGHHGSKNSGSEEFLQIMKPRLTLISAGIENRYGHPHEETLERLQEIGSEVLSTQECGAITLRSDGRKIKVHKYL